MSFHIELRPRFFPRLRLVVYTMADSGPINLSRFATHAKKLHGFWLEKKENPKIWNNADAVCVVAGNKDEDAAGYQGSSTVHRYLFGLDLPGTIVVVTEKEFIVLTSKKKKEILSPASAQFSDDLKLTVIEKVKGDNQWSDNFTELTKAIQASLKGSVLASLVKETPVGPFAAAWKATVDKSGVQVVSASTGINLAVAVKSDEEIQNVKKASYLSYKAIKAFSKRMWKVIDDDKGTFKHSALAKDVDDDLDDPANRMGVSNADTDLVEPCYTPLVQSGSECKVSINQSGEMENEDLSFDLITCQLGARYDSYCSNIARTYFVNPPKCIERAYILLLEVQLACLEAFKPGEPLMNVYQAAKLHIETHGKDLLEYFTPNCGSGIGLMIRDASHVLSHKNKRIINAGMAFNLCIGFEAVPVILADKDVKKEKTGARALSKFTVMLADTVLLADDGKVEVLTQSAKKNWSAVAQTLDASSDEEEEESEPAKKEESRREMRERMQAEAQSKTLDLEQKRKEITKKKAAEMQQRNLAKKREVAGLALPTKTEEDLKISAYESITRIPTSSKPTRLSVDTENKAILLPIYNMLVPFHIMTVKSVSINDEGHRSSYLTINFYAPGDKAKNMPEAVTRAIEDLVSRNVFVRSMMFKSSDQKYLNDQLRAIKQLQKDTREQSRIQEEAKDVIEQAALEVWPRERGRPLMLPSPVYVRPRVGKSRKNQGQLQCHLNGFRFRPQEGGDRLDIIYSNVRHLIVQKCDGKIHDVLLHIHLRSPILVNHKKCKALTFYYPVIEASEALDDSRRNMYDPDEIDEEQRQRKIRKRYNKMFKEFADKVVAHVGKYAPGTNFPKLQSPYMDLGFHGVCNKEMVRITPSVDCLLNISHSPAFLVSLDDVEHFHFERVTFSNKNFDMVIIFNDIRTFKNVTSIEMRHLEGIKEWVLSINKTFTTGNTPMAWDKTLASIREEMEVELEDGTNLFWSNIDEMGEKKDVGWDILNVHSDHEGDEEGDDDDDESEFTMDEDEESESSEESWDEDVSDESGLDSEVVSNSEDEEAEDWDAMDKKAEMEDRKKRARDNHRDDRYHKKSRR